MAQAPSGLNATASGEDINLSWFNEDPYGKIWIQYRESGGSWTTITNTYGGSEEEYTDTNVTQNVSISYRVAGYDIWLETWSAWSNIDSAGCYADTLTEAITLSDTLTENLHIVETFDETITITDSLTEIANYVETFTETITISDRLYETHNQPNLTFPFYLMDETGKVYEYGKAYTDYAGRPISSTWMTKQTDFSDPCIEHYINGYMFHIHSDQYFSYKNGESSGNSLLDSIWQRDSVDEKLQEYFQTFQALSGKFKLIDRIRLYYVDKQADMTMGISVSTDGGTNWNSSIKTFGTGDGKNKVKDFFIRKTGHNFIILLSTSGMMQWAGLDILFKPLGRHFELN